MNRLIVLVLGICFAVAQCSAGIENSIVPMLDKYEQVENLPVQKYSKNQYAEICTALEQREKSLRLVTFNMLFTIYEDTLSPEYRWTQRLPRIVEVLKEIDPDLIAPQELLRVQADDLLACIGDTFAFYGKTSNDGEINGLFYRKDRFEITSSKIWTLSQDKWVTLTMVQLKDLRTGECFAVFNSHLTFGVVDSREEQMRAIMEYVEPVAQQMPVLLAADFNAFPNRLDLEKLPFLDGDYIHRIVTRGTLRDSRELALLGHLGPISTFTNQPADTKPFEGLGTPGVILDRIYVSPGLQVLIHAVQPATVNGRYPSDHMPVVVDFIIAPTVPAQN